MLIQINVKDVKAKMNIFKKQKAHVLSALIL